MLRKVTRVAELAWSTVEDKLDNANLAQATICAGIATERMVLLGGEPMHRIDVNLSVPNIIERMQALHAQIVEACAQLPDPPTLGPKLFHPHPLPKIELLWMGLPTLPRRIKRERDQNAWRIRDELTSIRCVFLRDHSQPLKPSSLAILPSKTTS